VEPQIERGTGEGNEALEAATKNATASRYGFSSDLVELANDDMKTWAKVDNSSISGHRGKDGGCLMQKMSQQGITVSGNNGTIVQSGVTITRMYDPKSQVLEITCNDSPFWAPCGLVNAKIHDSVEQPHIERRNLTARIQSRHFTRLSNASQRFLKT
jgi:hypothetical protein